MIARILAALAGLSLVAPAQAALPTERNALLDLVQRHFTQVRTMTANFVQTGPDGRQMRGAMTLARPGKVRFQYEPTVPFLVVADGRQVSLVDYEVAQVQRYPIRETPLASLLGSADGLRQYAQTIRVADQSGIEILTVEAQDKRRPEYGRLTLYFQDAPGAPAGLLPIGWTVVDNQGQTTQVQLTGVKFNPAVSDGAFRYRDPRGAGVGPRGR